MLPIWFSVSHSLESELVTFIVTGYPACSANVEEKPAGFVESQNKLGSEGWLEVSIPTLCLKQDCFQRQRRMIWAFSSPLLSISRHEDSPGSLESLVRALSALVDLNSLTSLTRGPLKYPLHSCSFSAQPGAVSHWPSNTVRVLISSSDTAFAFPWP